MSDRLTRCHVAAWLLMAGIFLPFVSPQAETTLRVGITSFSTSRGNPFGTTSGLPPLYTYAAFFEGLTGMLLPLLPRYTAEGKSALTIAVGCTGGRHRSVLVAEKLAAWLAEREQRVSVRHRDLGDGAP